MSRIRSKQLLQYLLENNINFQDREALAIAKAEYRKLYKKSWKKASQKNRELRPTFSEQEYEQLCKRAELLGLTPTAYLRQLILTNQENRELIPHREDLLLVLQSVSMAAINPDRSLIEQAERRLLAYLRNH